MGANSPKPVINLTSPFANYMNSKKVSSFVIVPSKSNKAKFLFFIRQIKVLMTIYFVRFIILTFHIL